jgi:hypothetical protein
MEHLSDERGLGEETEDAAAGIPLHAMEAVDLLGIRVRLEQCHKC